MEKATYETDVIAWAQEQARLLRAGRFDALDIEHIAEEIEDVGKSEQRELASRMVVLLCHLLKWRYQPERRGSSWEKTIRVQRESVARRLKKTPSLKAALQDSDWWDDVWGDARLATEQETSIPYDKFPDCCLWTADQVLSQDFLPN